MSSAGYQSAAPATAGAPARDPARSAARGPGRRAGRRKTAVLEAAGRVIAERGADATRFADVAAESGVPVSTLQYYFGSREDLLVAAFRHASNAEIAVLEADIAALGDPWDQLERIVTGALTGYGAGAPIPGRLWIESWHSGIRDPEMRADTLRDYAAWRGLVADTVRRGIQQGAFGDAHRPEMVAVLAIALVDGVGVPLALSDPEVSVPGAIRDVLAALRELLRPRLPVTPLVRRLRRPGRGGDLECLVHVDAVA
jgi:AcrR family transcriptional regulator